jgi:hypothetical protein
MDNQKKLREKLKKKRQERTNGATPEPPPETGEEIDFVKMMDNVKQILKTNPEMVRQVSKCVSNVMANPELMKSLLGQVGQDIQLDQTLDNNLVGEDLDASKNDPKQ